MSKIKKTIIWTRAQHNWLHDQQIIHAKTCQYRDKKQFRVIHLPCTKMINLEINLKKVITFINNTHLKTSAILTSTYALTRWLKLSIDYKITTLVMGKAAYIYDKNNKHNIFINTHSKNGSELFSFICNHYDSKNYQFILPGASSRAFPLAKKLKALGYNVLTINLYQTITPKNSYDHHNITTINKLLQTSFPLSSNNNHTIIVAFASPSAIYGFCQQINHVNRLKNITALAIGQTTANTAKKYFNSCSVASQATIDELLNAAIHTK